MTHNREPAGPAGENLATRHVRPYLAVRGDLFGVGDNLPLDPRDAESWFYSKRRNRPTRTLGPANARGVLSPSHGVERSASTPRLPSYISLLAPYTSM